MKYELYITRMAYLDLQEATDYIAYELFNPDAADHLQDEVEEMLRQLVSFPDKYPLASDQVLRNWKLRFVTVGNYYLFYTVREGKIYVVRFLYKRRDWMTILKKGMDLD